MVNKIRCPWLKLSNNDYVKYHDQEWGEPVYDDIKHFEMLILEGAQAGLSWEIILKKRDIYREVFYGFDPKKVAAMTDDELETLLLNPGVIRNRLKIFSTRKNANSFLEIQKEYGSFNYYVWDFVKNRTVINKPKTLMDIPTRSTESDALSKDLKKRGMNFVGPTIIYAYMQAIGMVNDHIEDCFKHMEL
jgi:DNA-3-methyladenine glycosylase I